MMRSNQQPYNKTLATDFRLRSGTDTVLIPCVKKGVHWETSCRTQAIDQSPECLMIRVIQKCHLSNGRG